LIHRERHPIAPDDEARLNEFCSRRLSGISVHRILGWREFWSLRFNLNEATLEPRPETEALVERAIAELASRPSSVLLDLGTGTGCIPIAILSELREMRAYATDLAPLALEMARENAFRLGVLDRLRLTQGSWYEPLPMGRRFSVITSNPPYIRSDDIAGLAPEVRDHDPLLALDGGPSGLEPYREIIARAPAFLEPEGLLIVEIGYDQGREVAALFDQAGFEEIAVERDLSGQPRVVSGRHP
jgi:release factor glutamine methyltransferase